MDVLVELMSQGIPLENEEQTESVPRWTNQWERGVTMEDITPLENYGHMLRLKDTCANCLDHWVRLSSTGGIFLTFSILILDVGMQEFSEQARYLSLDSLKIWGHPVSVCYIFMVLWFDFLLILLFFN